MFSVRLYVLWVPTKAASLTIPPFSFREKLEFDSSLATLFMMSTHAGLPEALSDIVTGSGATRSKHVLTLDGKSVIDEFVQCLKENGFVKTTVGEVEVEIGQRVPAFFIEDGTAWFGWVFWEKFTEKKARKLWGSVVRNAKGDWAIQIPPTKPTPIYASPADKIEMDTDRPVYL